MLFTLCDRNGLNTDPSKSWWSGRSRWSGVSRGARLAISSSRSKISLGKKETLRESHVTNSQMEWKTSRIVFLCRQCWCLIYSTLSWNYFLCLDFPIKNLIFFSLYLVTFSTGFSTWALITRGALWKHKTQSNHLSKYWFKTCINT